eukprot:jgi/Orpsp1_1/1175640/evm.model.c7180000054652.1
MSLQSDSESNILNDEEFKENLRNISKLYITRKFNPAYELCEKCVKTFEVINLINIFDKKKDEEDGFNVDEDYFLSKAKKEKKEKEDANRTIIPSDLLQIYLKIIEQIKPETDCWDILNKYYKDVNEISSKILTTCALIEVKKQNLEKSKKCLKKWLKDMPEEERIKLREKQQPNFKFYEMLIEIYILHILTPLEEYNSSIDFLEGEDYLTMDRKKLICDKVIRMETIKGQEKQQIKNAKSEQKSTNKNLFSGLSGASTSSTTVEKDVPENENINNKEITKKSKSKQRRVSNKHQNKYDIGNAVIDGSYDPFWKVLSKFLMDKAPFILVVILIIVIRKNPELIRGTIFERILKKLYETIMLIININ